VISPAGEPSRLRDCHEEKHAALGVRRNGIPAGMAGVTGCGFYQYRAGKVLLFEE
jgi:hypothetical protein